MTERLQSEIKPGMLGDSGSDAIVVAAFDV
jgi:hypothetical protein